MTGVRTSKKRGADGEGHLVLRRAVEMALEDVHMGTTLSKSVLKFPMKKTVKGGSASGTTIAHLLNGICLGIEEGKAELKSWKVKLEKKVARLESDLALEGERLVAVKAVHKVLIREAEVPADGGVVTGLDSVFLITDLENWGEENEKGQITRKTNELEQTQADQVSSKIVLEQLKSEISRKDNELKKAQADLIHFESVANQLSEALSTKDMDFLMVQKLCDELNDRVAQLKTNLAMANSLVKKAEDGEQSKKRKDDVGRGNERLRETQDKLDIALRREQELEGVIRGKDQLLREKDELLKKAHVGGSKGNDRELEEFRA
ncbi:hypothetical protein GIB67_021446 [Kingdonia uniflora]|uniref:Uncharacterized protein n=1 Tax=Kingdonia uniflora TaxID=39325 RepID=A0A7J7NQS9_9MAGN|nr:hypothetical protein GIB67_021446 [Kingdonia uniflora]